MNFKGLNDKGQGHLLKPHVYPLKESTIIHIAIRDTVKAQKEERTNLYCTNKNQLHYRYGDSA